MAGAGLPRGGGPHGHGRRGRKKHLRPGLDPQGRRRLLRETTEGLAKVVGKAFKEQGRPNGYIKGEEISAAITVGLRYGNGQLTLKNGGKRKVFWQGPSIGFDLGANAFKVFILVYHMAKADSIVLAPIRLGVGLRAGASVGHMHFPRTKTLNPP